MDQTRTAGAGDEPAKRIVGGDAPPAASAAVSGGACFDCNICLECATEPVVTLCGHLYCWPCIYEWLRPDADANAGSSPARRRCPVCKAAVSPDALVPLYGRGGGSSRAKKPPRGLASTGIPRRPALRAPQESDIGDHHHHRRNVDADSPGRAAQQQAARHHHADATELDAILAPPFADRGVMQSTAGGVLGGMAVAVLPWVLRGQAAAQTPGTMYYSTPYHLMNPRQRRRHMEVERSLHQIWFFLFVFVLLCLLLF
ncbi:hypothetical protein HU200_007382 [Digitaria exilis]|uniref:E3 ubiquitin-protein ligase RMA n=1 Tax=Digitaria exilis TaxID=1010633 RepID=A0A835FPY9_9POAL|nr:hypothetical protein HU200_007382 [Digitaria exilis]